MFIKQTNVNFRIGDKQLIIFHTYRATVIAPLVLDSKTSFKDKS